MSECFQFILPATLVDQNLAPIGPPGDAFKAFMKKSEKGRHFVPALTTKRRELTS